MAIIKGGIFGGFTGKIGDVIGYIRYGKSFIKTKSRKRKKKASKKQLLVRENMKVAVNFMKTLKEFVAIGFAHSGAKNKRSAYSDALSYQIRNALTGEHPDVFIDLAKVKLATGNMPPPYDTSIGTEGNGIRFNWKVALQGTIYHSLSRAMLLVYVPSLQKSFFNISAARITEKTDFMELPDSFKNQVLHAYMAFASDDRKKISDSVYIGSLTYQP